MATCFYAILGVKHSASIEDINKAYKKKALELHPDKNPDAVQESTENFKLLQQAYGTLSNPSERKIYSSDRYIKCQYCLKTSKTTKVKHEKYQTYVAVNLLTPGPCELSLNRHFLEKQDVSNDQKL
ncbi:hypothetical protein LAZ67_10003885 [Cordylochernes scorpioides]|uniref:J domain-containing protein n=1 Tax=Cordylochernes scorpioides TaxID=51811 RepID=A0ABY6KX97_9ARAC|nr:hypothetical protein LAZ67_10003885 [Cordylochernes scorpioides]